MFNFSFYLKHILYMEFKLISGVSLTCSKPCTTSVGHTEGNMTYLYYRNLLPFLLKCNTKFFEKYRCSLILGSAYIIIEPRYVISNNVAVDSDEPMQPPFKLRHSK